MKRVLIIIMIALSASLAMADDLDRYYIEGAGGYTAYTEGEGANKRTVWVSKGQSGVRFYASDIGGSPYYDDAKRLYFPGDRVRKAIELYKQKHAPVGHGKKFLGTALAAGLALAAHEKPMAQPIGERYASTVSLLENTNPSKSATTAADSNAWATQVKAQK
jgi:hypothetical protein